MNIIYREIPVFKTCRLSPKIRDSWEDGRQQLDANANNWTPTKSMISERQKLGANSQGFK